LATEIESKIFKHGIACRHIVIVLVSLFSGLVICFSFLKMFEKSLYILLIYNHVHYVRIEYLYYVKQVTK